MFQKELERKDGRRVERNAPDKKWKATSFLGCSEEICIEKPHGFFSAHQFCLLLTVVCVLHDVKNLRLVYKCRSSLFQKN